jgi:hypothetical protein
MPPPPWPEYEFNQSGTWGCDAYSVALDTTYFLYDTPERFLLIKNASWDAMDKNLKDKAKAAGKPEPQFDGWGPGSGIDYVAKFAIPIMKRHGTVRNAISNLFIDEKVVSVNYEVSDPVFDLIFSDDPSVVARDTHHPSLPTRPSNSRTTSTHAPSPRVRTRTARDSRPRRSRRSSSASSAVSSPS